LIKRKLTKGCQNWSYCHRFVS